MATLPVTHVEQPNTKLTPEEAAAELYRIVEGHFDDLGLTEEQRDERYSKLDRKLQATNAAAAKA